MGLSTESSSCAEIYADLNGFIIEKLQASKPDKIYAIYKSRIDSTKCSKQLRVLWANRLFSSLVSGVRDESREKVNLLNDSQIEFIQEELRSSIRNGNLGAYEKVFLLHLFNSRGNYPIKAELHWLKNWIEADKSPQSLLWGNYFIAILYYTKVLLNGKDIEGAKASAERYISETKKKAELLKRNDTKEFFYFKNATELRSITEYSDKASWVEGRITKISQNRQGFVLLDCGLEASFSPKSEFFIEDASKQTRVRAKVGFRFSGLGLYGIERIEGTSNEEQLSQIQQEQDEEEKMSDKEPVESVDGSKPSGQCNWGTKTGEIDLKTKEILQKNLSRDPRLNLNKHIPQQDVNAERMEGCISIKYGKKEIRVGDKRHYYKVKGRIPEDVYDGADVTFELGLESYESGGRMYPYAVNVELKEE